MGTDSGKVNQHTLNDELLDGIVEDESLVFP